VAFETLQTEGWVAGFEKLKSECARQNIKMLEAIADGDANRQFQQVKNFINLKVDGIIIAPKDSKTVIPMIKAANAANIPVVLYNRPADPTPARHTVITADNVALTRQTVSYLIEQARKTGRKHQAMVLIGDLGDINAIGRRDGFESSEGCAGRD
jgi:ABC-type sugar transport system substrate-binding protein